MLYLLLRFYIYIIKYPYLVNLFVIINILLCFCPIINFFNLGNLIIKSYNITVGIYRQEYINRGYVIIYY